MNHLSLAKSLLFVPANRPDRFLKALNSGADAVILDLEDSVPLQSKSDAREAIRQNWSQFQMAPCAVAIRINSPETQCGQQDLSVLQALRDLAGLVVPKCESSKTLQRVAQDFHDVALLPLIESAAGYLSLSEIARAPQVCRLVVGHIDFLADTGMNCSDDQRELDTLRFHVAMHTSLANLAPAVDGVTVSVDDANLIRKDTERSLRFGFGGKLCIHPKQIQVVHDAFAPTAQQVEWATRVIAAMESSQGSAVQLDGKMIDLPVVLQAQRIMKRAH